MEDVDNIIVYTLRQIGCNLSPEIRSIKEFSVEDIVEAVARGLKLIDPSREFPARLPKEMSSRYRVCSTLANGCQEFGFRGDLGYHQFLYPTESETRRLLMWMVETLPKMDKQQEGETSLGSAALLQRAVSSETTERLKQPWVPAPLLKNGLFKSSQGSQSWHYRSARSFYDVHTSPLTLPHHSGDLTVNVPKETRRYWETQLPFVTAQPSHKRDTAVSLFEKEQEEIVAAQEWEADWNRNGLQSGLSKEDYRNRKRLRLRGRIGEQVKTSFQRAVKDEVDILEQIMSVGAKGYAISSRFSQQTKLAEETPVAAETEEELAQRRAQELQALRDKLSELTISVDDLEKAMQGYESNIKQLESKLQESQLETKALEAAYKIKKRTFDLLDDPDKNIAMLKENIDTSAARMLELAAQWEQKRVPLIQEYRNLKDKQANRLAESLQKLEKIKEFRQLSKTLADEARERNELYKQLVEEYERLPKDVQRSQYTDRIMEIVKNVKKQNLEIDKVLQDTRQLQKEISGFVATLGRTYAATDELVFRDAKTNDFSKRSYKLLVAIHETCGDLTKIVEETGALRNASRDLEDKIDQLNAEKTSQNLQKIMEDYDQVKKENAEIIQTIKKAQLGVA